MSDGSPEALSAAKKKLAEANAAREKSRQASAKLVSEVKPTPTQEECDLAAMGVYLAEHEADGSPPDTDEDTLMPLNKSLEGKPRATYSTKASTA